MKYFVMPDGETVSLILMEKRFEKNGLKDSIPYQE